MALRSVSQPIVRKTALAIVSGCESRDDKCELEAIFNAVKNGDSRVSYLRGGFKYVADPRSTDYFTAPHRALEMCAEGACGGDCDDHAALVAALTYQLGFKSGLRAWGRYGKDYSHVYAVVATPKRRPSEVLGMDTTVNDSYVGWEPPPGRVLTAWLP